MIFRIRSFHEMEEDSVIYASEGAFEVRVSCVYISFISYFVFVHHVVGGEAVVYISLGTESVCGVAKDALSFGCFVSYVGEDRCPYLEYAVHKRYGSIVGRVMWVGFVLFVDEFGGAGAPFLFSVAVFGHELE